MIISKSFLLKISNVKGVLFLNLLILKYIKLEIKVGHGFAQMWQVRLKTKLAEFFLLLHFLMLLGPPWTIPLNQALREVLLSTIQSRDDCP